MRKSGLKIFVLGTMALAIVAGASVLIWGQPFTWRNGFDPRGDAFWEYEFLARSSWFQQDMPTFQNHIVHPLLGWVPKPGLIHESEYRETTNNLGHRSLVDYSPRPEAYTILAVGDSFTYGSWADDTEVWPTILQGLDERYQVINLAVGGYGVDQMYLRLREGIGEFNPRLVVFALISDDLNRSLLGFREYRKPLLVISPDGGLTVTNTPIGEISETRRYLKEKKGWFGNRGFVLEDEEFRGRLSRGDYDRDWQAINAKIIESAITCTRENGSDFLLVHLAAGPEMTNSENMDGGVFPSEMLLHRLSQKFNVAYLATRKTFAEAGESWTGGHYRGSEARLVATEVHKQIQDLSSWRGYCKSPDTAQAETGSYELPGDRLEAKVGECLGNGQ
jgi:hypothetical protein